MGNVVFFLGAGASRCAGGPLIGDFVPSIRRRIEQGEIPEDTADVLDRLSREAAKSGGDVNNIEDLLRAANDEPERERRETLRQMSLAIALTLELSIGFSFSERKLVSSDNSYWHLAKLLSDLSKHKPGCVAIVTVNYDVCADVAISETGRRPYYCLNRERLASDKEISLAKLHGSLNWIGCVGSGCGHVDAKYHIPYLVSEYGRDWPAIPHHHLRFPKSRERCNGCGDQIQSPLIVPPVPDKGVYGREMQVVWDRAKTLLQAADFIALAGYSCAEIDKPVNDLISHAGGRKTVLIANPSCEARERARILLPSAKFLPSVGGLDEAVQVIRSQGYAG